MSANVGRCRHKNPSPVPSVPGDPFTWPTGCENESVQGYAHCMYHLTEMERKSIQSLRGGSGSSGLPASQEELNEIEYMRLTAREKAKVRHAAEIGGDGEASADERQLLGGSWLCSETEELAPLWGTSETPLWMAEESLMFTGPPGVGKSTLTHMIVFGRMGIIPTVLGYPVTDDGGKVLYLAMDRPGQLRRAMRRLVTDPEKQRVILDERLVVWTGPLPVDITRQENRRFIVNWMKEIGATTVVIDSLKDIIPNASDEEKAGGYNRSRQEVLAEGFSWLEIHHNRKNGGAVGTKPPDTLDDVYGSRWITAGAGSVMSLFGQSTDIVVRLSHLKAPGEPLTPMNVEIDRRSGLVTPYENVNAMSVLLRAGQNGVTANDLAQIIYETQKPTKSNVASARKMLDRLCERKDGRPALVERFETQANVRYRLVGATGGTDPLSGGRQPDGEEDSPGRQPGDQEDTGKTARLP
ncbi:AAA family ATPase [Nonomuraea bangladeshensis]|uniref:AAA family ATPase n=1 Tax=Nonomuraea bangladeshensis TaxID=404385 RepID=A0ABV3H220_9ACTN